MSYFLFFNFLKKADLCAHPLFTFASPPQSFSPFPCPSPFFAVFLAASSSSSESSAAAAPRFAFFCYRWPAMTSTSTCSFYPLSFSHFERTEETYTTLLAAKEVADAKLRKSPLGKGADTSASSCALLLWPCMFRAALFTLMHRKSCSAVASKPSCSSCSTKAADAMKARGPSTSGASFRVSNKVGKARP